MIPIEIAKYIRLQRLKLGYTQQQVSIKIPITEANYNRIETGKSVPHIRTFFAICQVLEIDWNTVKKNYLDLLHTPSQLFELSSFCFKQGDNVFAKRVLSKLFSIAKQIEQPHLITVGLFQILYCDMDSRNEILAREVTSRMCHLGKKRTVETIKKVVLEKY